VSPTVLGTCGRGGFFFWGANSRVRALVGYWQDRHLLNRWAIAQSAVHNIFHICENFILGIRGQNAITISLQACHAVMKFVYAEKEEKKNKRTKSLERLPSSGI